MTVLPKYSRLSKLVKAQKFDVDKGLANQLLILGQEMLGRKAPAFKIYLDIAALRD